MAEKENPKQPKDLVQPLPEELEAVGEEPEIKELEEKIEESQIIDRKLRALNREEATKRASLDSWVPKTKLGLAVKSGKEKNLDKILSSGKRIMEPQIIDTLVNLETDLLLIGQSKGKFGGGKRRAWRQTQKKTKEGNVLTFSSMAVVGDRNGHVGLGYGKAKETLPTREKALRDAKLSLIKVTLGFETPKSESSDSKPHTVPFKVQGKCGSVRLTILPAPRGTGLVIGDECKKILRLAGIKDVYSDTKGKVRTTFNTAKACIDALKKTSWEMKE